MVCHSYVPLTPEAAWLNNCVGHYNHRYFFSFCLFMTMGCIYCSISGWAMFRDAYAAIEVSGLSCHVPRLPGFPRLSLQSKAGPGPIVTLLPLFLLLRGPQLLWSCVGVRGRVPAPLL